MQTLKTDAETIIGQKLSRKQVSIVTSAWHARKSSPGHLRWIVRPDGHLHLDDEPPVMQPQAIDSHRYCVRREAKSISRLLAFTILSAKL